NPKTVLPLASSLHLFFLVLSLFLYFYIVFSRVSLVRPQTLRPQLQRAADAANRGMPRHPSSRPPRQGQDLQGAGGTVLLARNGSTDQGLRSVVRHLPEGEAEPTAASWETYAAPHTRTHRQRLDHGFRHGPADDGARTRRHPEPLQQRSLDQEVRPRTQEGRSRRSRA